MHPTLRHTHQGCRPQLAAAAGSIAVAQASDLGRVVPTGSAFEERRFDILGALYQRSVVLWSVIVVGAPP